MVWVWYQLPPIPPVGSGITAPQQEQTALRAARSLEIPDPTTIIHLFPTAAAREFLARARPSNYSLYLSNMGQCYIYEVIHVDNDVWTALFYKALSLRFSISLIWWAENNDSHVRNLEKPINV